MHRFRADIDIIGINPFVFIPASVLNAIFKEAGKDKGPVPVHGTVNKNPYKQTLVKYRGEWRLYINTIMLKDSPGRIGESITSTIAYDPEQRIIQPHPRLVKAFKEDTGAKRRFDALPASRQKEILRYIANLKTEDSIEKNVKRAIDFLNGKERFIGRDKP